MRPRRSQIFGLAGGVLLLALLSLPSCKRRSLGGDDAGVGRGGSGGGLPSLDGGAGQGGSAIGGQGGTPIGGSGGTIFIAPPDAAFDGARDAGADMRRDAPPDLPPPRGFIPCGNTSCDPAREFCEHWVSGLVPDARMCQPLLSGCAPGGTNCGCLLRDGGGPPFCFACRVIAGTETAGLELDCPGPID